MCFVSMVSQHYFDQWPSPNHFPPDRYMDFQELIKKARKYDEMTGQKDCPDPAKDQWKKAVEEFMRDKYGLEPKE